MYEIALVYAAPSAVGVYRAVYQFKTLALCLSAYNTISTALLKGETAVELKTTETVSTCNLRNALFVIRNKDFEESIHAE